MSKPILITKEEFSKLKRGDVVFMNDQPRIVHEGPADQIENPQRKKYFSRPFPQGTLLWIRFARKRLSHYTSISVVYHYHDVSRILTLPEKKISGFALRCLLRMEAQQLREMGLNWRQQLANKMKEEYRLAKAGLGCTKCTLKRHPELLQ